VRDESGRPVFNPELFKRIILEIKEKCPDILVDPDQVQQVFVNIILTPLKQCPKEVR
jgi:signal transduction histidine kinase